jgi:hypothetical protein
MVKITKVEMVKNKEVTSSQIGATLEEAVGKFSNGTQKVVEVKKSSAGGN